MARTKYTVSFPAAKAGDEVTWPNTVKVYPDANAVQPLGNGYIEAAGGSFVGWSDATSVTFTRAGTDAVTVTSTSPTGTGAAPSSNAASSWVAVKVTANHAAADHEIVFADATGGVFNVTAPAAGLFVVRNTGASNSLTVLPHASERVEGGSSKSVGPGQSFTFAHDGTDWWVV